MKWLIALLITTQTLAPPPINFESITVSVEGKTYLVEFKDNKLSIEEETWQRRMERKALKMYIEGERTKGYLTDFIKSQPIDNQVDFGCAIGCLVCLVFLSLLCYLGWVVFNWM